MFKLTIDKIKLKEMQRVILLNYNSEADTIDFRHFDISGQFSSVCCEPSCRSLLFVVCCFAVSFVNTYLSIVKPVGVSKPVKGLISRAVDLPDLSGYDDISEFILRLVCVDMSMSVSMSLSFLSLNLSLWLELDEKLIRSRNVGYESDGEELNESGVELPQTVQGVGNMAEKKSALRLTGL